MNQPGHTTLYIFSRLTRHPATLATLAALTLSGCGVGYVLENGLTQMALLQSRRPIAEVRQSCPLEPAQAEALDLIEDVKRYGVEIGLAGSDNYETLAVGWDHAIWNLSACDPLSFTPETWWFPIVGRVPYLGFFDEERAMEQAEALRAEGLDVYLRTAGAYSTLGWFEDPVLISMLSWTPYTLIDTVLHELTHATVWIPGSVAFNESFASFVGQKAAFGYLRARYGESSEIFRASVRDAQDAERWIALLKVLYDELDALYKDPSIPDPEKLDRKAAAFDALPALVDAGGFHEPALYKAWIARRAWNNALLAQFRTYNSNHQWFQVIFEREGEDLARFMAAIARIADEGGDPYAALERAAIAEGLRSPAP